MRTCAEFELMADVSLGNCGKCSQIAHVNIFLQPTTEQVAYFARTLLPGPRRQGNQDSGR